MIEYVEIAAAREATGVRIVVPGAIPSPWSEATKGLFRLARIPVRAVRMSLGKNVKEIAAWTGVDNVPIVLHHAEPARTSWSAIVGLVARLAPDTILPTDVAARTDVMGVLEMIAGEDGLGWNTRLAMVEAGLTSEGARGFGVPAATYLAQRYDRAGTHVRERTTRQLNLLHERLVAAQTSDAPYFGGAAPNAIDVYAATFLTPFVPLGEEDCPRMHATVRHAFAAAAEELGPLVSAELARHRRKMFADHLGWPIAL